jgi:hypothetical protein
LSKTSFELTVTPTPTAKKSRPIMANTKALFLANFEPTEELNGKKIQFEQLVVRTRLEMK